MVEIRAAHLIGDEDQQGAEEAVRKDKAPDLTAAQPSQQMLDHGVPFELMQSVVKDFVKQALERQAARMPTQHVPAQEA